MTRPRKVVILGSTGSIGTSALKVARKIPEHMEVVGLAAGRRAGELVEQAREFGVKHLAIADESLRETVAESAPAGSVVHAGAEGLRELARLPEADMVLVSIVGTEGLQPALDAIESGKDLAVASKEILVMAGEIVMAAAERSGVRVLPVDSEHNAIFQCLEGNTGGAEAVRRLLLTASGGPFRTASAESLADVTPEQALNHPTWKMGPKITIDSATLFNKGLEMIEARWLFGVEMDRVEVVVHPQSIVHSMVEFVDGSVLAQVSTTDMCFPIQYAVTWPQRVQHSLEPLDFAALARLDFEDPREDVFPALRLAREAGTCCGTLPAVMNAANEVAVEAFLKGAISFPRIWGLVEEVMTDHVVMASPSLEALVEADLEARAAARAGVERVAG
ncbi:MAG: 1-deoxy-D-xylulose-5-phosphate reductoisomerase [Verrucomicrobiota bacterium]|nr:1-deoxy-D-xylulose-5-phosphate reductoisomerase [Verrucomicrobiota bacterium]